MRLPVTDTVSIYQFVRSGDTESYNTTPAYTNINACITPTGTDIVPSGEAAAFQLFEIFLYDVTLTIHNADKIVNQNGTQYIVDGMPFVINNQYLRYIRLLGRQVV